MEDIDAVDYANYLRMAFKRYILYKYTMDSDVLFAYQVHPQIETRIRSIAKNSLRDKEYQLLMQSILNETQKSEATGRNAVLLTQYDTRKSLRRLIEREFPWLAVLSYQELQPYTDVRSLGQIAWDSNGLAHEISV